MALVVLALVLPPLALAQAPQGGPPLTVPPPGSVISAIEAHQLASSGEIVLVDIRTPEEWKETGVPTSGHAVSMSWQARKFLLMLDKATGGDKARPVALICATGSRSKSLQGALSRHGYQTVLDVAEGMLGGRGGPGWIRSGLPVRSPSSGPGPGGG